MASLIETAREARERARRTQSAVLATRAQSSRGRDANARKRQECEQTVAIVVAAAERSKLVRSAWSDLSWTLTRDLDDVVELVER